MTEEKEVVEEVHVFEEAFESLGTRTVSALIESSFENLEELQEATDKDLMAIKGIGKRTVAPMRGLLAELGFEKAEELEETNAEAKLRASLTVPHGSTVEAFEGPAPAEDDGKIRVKLNLFDPGYRRPDNQKLSLRIGDIIEGNEDKSLDLDKKYVAKLVARGDAA